MILMCPSVEADTSTSGTPLLHPYSYSFLLALGKMPLSLHVVAFILQDAFHGRVGIARRSMNAVWKIPQACVCRYCFSLYSSQIKEHFGYSQEEIQGIGSAANLGMTALRRIPCLSIALP